MDNNEENAWSGVKRRVKKSEVDVLAVERDEKDIAVSVTLYAGGWETEWVWGENGKPLCVGKINYGSRSTFIPENTFEAMIRRARAILSEKR